VDPVPYSQLLGKSGSAGNRTRTSRSVARNSDYWIPLLLFDHKLTDRAHSSSVSYSVQIPPLTRQLGRNQMFHSVWTRTAVFFLRS
jgi:hypothetical protein